MNSCQNSELLTGVNFIVVYFISYFKNEKKISSTAKELRMIMASGSLEEQT